MNFKTRISAEWLNKAKWSGLTEPPSTLADVGPAAIKKISWPIYKKAVTLIAPFRVQMLI